MNRATPLKRSPLLADPEKTRGWQDRSRARAKPSHRPVSPASPAQRRKVAGKACIVCAGSPCHPAHGCPRGMGGCDHPDCAIPLCPHCHLLWDTGHVSILEHVVAHGLVVEMAHMLAHYGDPVTVCERLTNDRVTWKSTRREQAA